jgi:predicted metalloprotease with PDZ domain
LLRSLLLTGLLVSASALAQNDPPPPAPAPLPPLPPAEVGHPPEARDAELEAQLEAARQKLQAAAREVADLSSEINRPFLQRFSGFNGSFGRAIIGVQLDPAGGKEGARVLEVSPGGPAAEAGIRAGDVIVAVNGTEVKGENASREIVKIIRDVKPDSKLNVRVVRDVKTLNFTVIARPGMAAMAAAGAIPLPPMPALDPLFFTQGHLSDMELATLTPQLGKYFGTEKGVLVVRAPADGILKLEDGDVIVSIDGREPKSGSHATRILGSYQPGEKIKLRIVRQHKDVDLETTVPEGGRRDMMFRGRGPDGGPPRDRVHRGDEAT